MCSGVYVSAQSTDFYVDGHYVVRDLQTVGKYDMLPVGDIATELGYGYYYEDGKFWLFNDTVSYEFTLGKASVFDQNGNWYGLDVVPQIIAGKVRIPGSFFTQVLGRSYTWDPITQTLFIGSDYTYRWLIGTREYQIAEAKKLASDYWLYDSAYEYINSTELVAENDTHYLIFLSIRYMCANGSHQEFFKVNKFTKKVSWFCGGHQGFEIHDAKKEFYDDWSPRHKDWYIQAMSKGESFFYDDKTIRKIRKRYEEYYGEPQG